MTVRRLDFHHGRPRRRDPRPGILEHHADVGPGHSVLHGIAHDIPPQGRTDAYTDNKKDMLYLCIRKVVIVIQ